MLFNQWSFLVFFLVVFGAYVVLPRLGQNVLLLVASYVFYSFWDWRFTSLLLISTVMDFYIGLALGRASSTRKRALIWLSVIVNLLFLSIFKYFNFFVSSLASLLELLHIRADLPTLNVVLPVGISFYTFMSLSYTIDVYRGDTKPCKSFLDYALFVAFFPHLVSGPIVRDTVLIPQLQNPRQLSLEKVQSGALLVLIGLARKFAADYLATDVEVVFARPHAQGALGLLAAVFMFALQIYGDFAGYTDIARGISRIMGIELVRNFEHPYFATNITAFWRRWHMSLSSWLRDYLYIPLGGNRGSTFFGYRNLMLTMLLGGLWHGAAWNFVIWGALHGVGLCAHKIALRGKQPEIEVTRLRLRHILGWAATMMWVGLAWIFFRAPTFADAMTILTRIAHFSHGTSTSHSVGGMLRHALVGFAILMFIDVPQWTRRTETVWLQWPWFARGVLYAAIILTLVLIRTNRDVPFIYFQF